MLVIQLICRPKDTFEITNNIFQFRQFSSHTWHQQSTQCCELWQRPNGQGVGLDQGFICFFFRLTRFSFFCLFCNFLLSPSICILDWGVVRVQFYGVSQVIKSFIFIRSFKFMRVFHWSSHTMMTSSHGNVFHVTGRLCSEFTGHWWIPLANASSFDVFFDLHLNKSLSKQ